MKQINYTLNHLAIIMDGNGRWAKKRELQRIKGHKKGVEVVKNITAYCAKLKIKHLSLYTFSNENWLRPKIEVSSLMKLFVATLNKEINMLIENDIQFKVLGDKSKLDFITRNKINEVEKKTKANNGMTMNLAMSYGSRQEILHAVNKAIENRKSNIDIDQFQKYLFTNNLPDPDLLIRTGKERRLSNFFLWQIAYSEIYFSNILWPDFNEKELDVILEDFKGRERRFGKISNQLQ